jgi:hypothetical protein
MRSVFWSVSRALHEVVLEILEGELHGVVFETAEIGRVRLPCVRLDIRLSAALVSAKLSV